MYGVARRLLEMRKKKNNNKVEKFFFFTVKSWKKKIKKINFINLFGYEVKKIIF